MSFIFCSAASFSSFDVCRLSITPPTFLINSPAPAENILLNTLFSYSYAPENLSEKDFLDIKINWLNLNCGISVQEVRIIPDV